MNQAMTSCRPAGKPDGPLKVLLFDSSYDRFRGVVCLVTVVDGVLRRGEWNLYVYSKCFVGLWI